MTFVHFIGPDGVHQTIDTAEIKARVKAAVAEIQRTGGGVTKIEQVGIGLWTFMIVYEHNREVL